MSTVIPEEVLFVVAFIDIGESPAQLDVLITGFARDGTAYVLGHCVVPGSIRDDAVQEELAELLDQRFEHPYGTIRIHAAAIDEGAGIHTDAARRMRLRMINRARVNLGNGRTATRWAHMHTSKGVLGADFLFKKSDTINGLILLGTVQLKAIVMGLLQAGTGIELSENLSDPWYKELAAEHRVSVEGRFGQVRVGYEKLVRGSRNEALDCLCGCVGLFHYYQRMLTLRGGFAHLEAAIRNTPQIVAMPDIDGAGDLLDLDRPEPYIPRPSAADRYQSAYDAVRPPCDLGDDPNTPRPPEQPKAAGSWFNRSPK